MNIFKNTTLKLMSISCLCFGFSQNTAHATIASGSASAQILANVNVSETKSMDFGRLVVSGSSETISLTPSGSITSSGTVQSQGAPQNAVFRAVGAPNALVSVSFQDGVLYNGAESMALTNFTHDAGSSPTLNSDGLLDVSVGADLHINADQAPGAYSGTYLITINYQ